jgi:hypothetical protein
MVRFEPWTMKQHTKGRPTHRFHCLYRYLTLALVNTFCLNAVLYWWYPPTTFSSEPLFFIPTTTDTTHRVHHHNNINNITHDTNATVALLTPPGFLGGYRNQVIRLISLCVHARQHDIHQLLLPSLVWGTQIDAVGYGGTWRSIPMDHIFDIHHWNSFAPHSVPRLVNADALGHESDCWSSTQNDSIHAYVDALQTLALQSGRITPIQNITRDFFLDALHVNPRKVDYLPLVEHCHNPKVYGGGKRLGRLWKDYLHYRSIYPHMVPFAMDRAVMTALQPAPTWRTVAHACIQQHTSSSFVALHARVELEFLHHPCGMTAESNLTTLLHTVQQTLTPLHPSLSALFVAVSRDGVVAKGDPKMYRASQAIADDNRAALDRYLGDGTTSTSRSELLGGWTVFTCGDRALQQYYTQYPNSPRYGSLLESVLNFYIAVQSDVFVGVGNSSYSADVFTTRYYQGKGDTNYRYSKTEGLVLVENGGLPEPHVNCRHRQNSP